MTKHQKVWPTYLEDGPHEELDALIEPRCLDRFQEPGHHLETGDVIPVRRPDGSDAYGVVKCFVIRVERGAWVGNEGAVLFDTYDDEATAISVGKHVPERGRTVQVRGCEPGTLWRWNAAIDAFENEAA